MQSTSAGTGARKGCAGLSTHNLADYFDCKLPERDMEREEEREGEKRVRGEHLNVKKMLPKAAHSFLALRGRHFIEWQCLPHFISRVCELPVK